MIFRSVLGDSFRRLVVGACAMMMVLPMTPLLTARAQVAWAEPICVLAEPGDTRCEEYTAMRRELSLVAFGQGWLEIDHTWQVSAAPIEGRGVTGSTLSGSGFTFSAEVVVVGNLIEAGLDPGELPWFTAHGADIRVATGTLTGPAGAVDLLAMIVSLIDDNGNAVSLMWPLSFDTVFDDPLALRPGPPAVQPPPGSGIGEAPLPPRIIVPVDQCGECWRAYADRVHEAHQRLTDRVAEAQRDAQDRRDAAGTAYRNSVDAAKSARGNALVAAGLMVGASLLLGFLRTLASGGTLAVLAMLAMFISLASAARKAFNGERAYRNAMRAAAAVLNTRLQEIEQDVNDRLDELERDFESAKADAERQLRECLAQHGCPPPPVLD